jgi:hypothetical protein
MSGANFDALAASHALFLVDHVDTGLLVLGNGLSLADLHALAALDADVDLGLVVLAGGDADVCHVYKHSFNLSFSNEGSAVFKFSAGIEGIIPSRKN